MKAPKKFSTLLRLFDVRDQLTKDIVAKEAACKKGCSACCSVAVSVSLTEAAILAGVVGKLPDRKKKVDVMREAHSLFVRNNGDKFAYFSAKHPCAFLSQRGVCTVYEYRPLVCRVANSTSAEKCADPSQEIERVSFSVDNEFRTILSKLAGNRRFLLASAVLFALGDIDQTELVQAYIGESNGPLQNSDAVSNTWTASVAEKRQEDLQEQEDGG